MTMIEPRRRHRARHQRRRGRAGHRARRRHGRDQGRARRADVCVAREDLPQARARHVPQDQVGGDGGHARHLLPAAVDPLGPRPEPSRPGVPARFRQPAAVLRPDRDLGAGTLLHHRAADPVGARAVPRHRRRRAHVVRLHVPADGVDRSDDRGRALLAGRPQRPHPPRQRSLDVREDLEEDGDARQLAAGRASPPAAPSSSTSAMRRRSPPSSSTATRRRSPTCSSACSRPRPTSSAASRASRCASTCARGRASRARCSTATRCSSPIAAIAASRAAPHKKGQSWEGRGDCIDCKACVAVCPMGIDIRDGAQLECIQCALCIDACDDIMQRIERPQGLIAYDTFRNLDAASHHERAPLRARAPAHAALRRADRRRRRGHARRLAQPLGAGGERPARPQSGLRAALRRRPAQRLHRQDPQQDARGAHLPARRRGPRRRRAVDRRARRGRAQRSRSCPTTCAR